MQISRAAVLSQRELLLESYAEEGATDTRLSGCTPIDSMHVNVHKEGTPFHLYATLLCSSSLSEHAAREMCRGRSNRSKAEWLCSHEHACDIDKESAPSYANPSNSSSLSGGAARELCRVGSNTERPMKWLMQGIPSTATFTIRAFS